mgnify:CR=1 FL=1
MPELPEVETTRRGIAPYLEGQRVSRVIVRERRLRWPIPEDLDIQLSGQRIECVERRAKYLLIKAESGCLIGHLGMSGSLRLVECGLPAAKHEHVDIELESGLALRYTDPRRFGALLWSAEPLSHVLLSKLGPEPLTDLFDGERLFQLSRGRSMAVKPFIMDNAVVVGVGNIYATEALFAAGIDPRREAGGISRARYLKLAIEIKRILAAAIELQCRWDFKARLHNPFVKQGRMCLYTCRIPDIADLCQNLICTFEADIHPHQAVKKRLHHG